MRRTQSPVRQAFMACSIAVALVIVTSAQVKPGATATDVALYTGADRMEKLIAGARKEGILSIYTSLQTVDIGKLAAAFEKKYGLKVISWRAGSEDIVQRSVQEARANRFNVDVMETNGPELESMHRENILQAVKSPYLADLIAPAILPHGEWVGTRLNVFVQSYNTRQIKKADLPKTWEDLANPKFKGKIGIEQEDSDWLAGIFSDIELRPEGQQIIANLEFVPTSRKIDTPLNKVPMKFVDAKVAIDEYDKWKGLYRQLFNIRGS